MFSTRFCRACTCEVNEPCEIVNNPGKPELPLLLKRYVPEFDIKVENACLCTDCVSTLYNFHNFKRKCLRTEEDLRLHIRKHPQVEALNLNDILAPKETYNTIDDIELSLETAVIPKRSVTSETAQPPSETATATTSAAPARRIIHCETCLLVFPSAKDLHFHYRKHHGRRRYQCDKCSRDFALEKPYHEHLEYHKRPGAGRFTCKICNFVYQWKHCLNKHNINKHLSDDKKSFQCEVCAMRFVEKEALIEHMRTHTGDRLYNCSVCDKYATTSVKELDGHIKAMHNVDSKF